MPYLFSLDRRSWRDLIPKAFKKLESNQVLKIDAAELIGDVVLFRNDDNAEPVDLSLAEWKEFCEVSRCCSIESFFQEFSCSAVNVHAVLLHKILTRDGFSPLHTSCCRSFTFFSPQHRNF